MNCSRLEKLFAVFSLVLFTEPLLPLGMRNGGFAIDTSPLSADNNPLRQGLFLAVYAVAFVLLVKRKSLEWATRDKFLLLLVVLAVVSISWSEDPTITLKRVLALLGTVVVGMYLASNYSFKNLIKLLAWSLGLAAVLSIGVALLAPTYGIMSDSSVGSWQGIYTHKNILGRTMALAAISFLLLATTAPKHRLIGWGGFLLSTLVVIKSHSLTALLALLAVLALLPGFMAMRRRPVLVPIVIAICLALGSATLWLTDSTDALPRALGRDITFTGRVDLWQSAALVIGKSPLLGHGYGTSAVTGGDDATTDIAQFSDWNAPNAHNGFLNLTLDLGFVGLTVFLLGYGLTLRRAITRLRAEPGMEAFWPPMFLTFLLLTNLMESVLLKHNSLDSVLYVATVLSTAAAVGVVPAKVSPAYGNASSAPSLS
jgi:exopolysaccharide production protein ExoQ